MKGHNEVFEALKREILAGKYDADMRLPSEMSLARRFGVSRPTVSRATLDLKREGLIVTRKGAPSAITRFAQNATGALGLVVPGESYAEIFRPLDRQLERLADRAGWDLIRGEIKGSNPKVRAREARRLAYKFAKERVCGVFFQPIEFLKDAAKASEEVVRYFEKAGIAVVLLDYDIAPPPERSRYDIVGIDNVAAGLAIGRHLLRAGAKRIAFLHRPNAAPTVTNRMRGVASAVVENGGSWSLKENVLFADPENRHAVVKFLKSGLPDAFVAGNDVAAAVLGETLAKIGRGAERIRLVGFDDVEVAAKLGLTTVRQPLNAIADAALQTLVSRIKAPYLPPRTILLDAELVIRN
jgi:LacI family transcriptional regulator